MFITEIFLFESDTKENCSEDFSQTSSLRSLSPLLEIRTEVKRKTKRDGSVMMVVVKWRGWDLKCLLLLWTRTKMLPLQIWTTPMTMMRPRAKSFPAVKTSWTQVAHRTLWQFTHVSSTEDGNRWHHNTTGFREQSWICSMVFYGVMFRFRSFCILAWCSTDVLLCLQSTGPF